MAQKNPAYRYNYPFANTAKDAQVHMQKDFSVQTAINKTKGSIIEVGGPSPDGFFFLKNCTFPRRPLITNINLKAGVKEKSLQAIYAPYIEAKLDIRKNTLADESVGVCLAGSLNIIAKEPKPGKQKAWDKAWEQLAAEDKALRSNPKTEPKIGLRFILLHHAHSFLEKGGLLILEGLREAELKYALAIGFTLRATTGPRKTDGQTMYQSVVLQK